MALNQDRLLLPPPLEFEATRGSRAPGSAGGWAQRALSRPLWWDGFHTCSEGYLHKVFQPVISQILAK